MKKTVYFDTTIISYLFDKRENIKNFIDITKEWWNTQSKRYKIYISNETLGELYRGNYNLKDKTLEFAEKIEVLPRKDEIIEIAQIYINNFVMPKNLQGDAIHLAYSSYYKIDFLLTWNCNHLANANKEDHIRRINAKLNLFIPNIVTPLQLFKEDLE